MLRVLNVKTGYGNIPILDGVDLDVGANEIMLLVGANGSGKSTLFKCIYGLNKVWNDGKITFDGFDITNSLPSKLLSLGLAYIPQTKNSYEQLSVLENLNLAAYILPRDIRKKRILELVELFPELSRNKMQLAYNLSGGEKQLLSLAMALVHQPKLIMFDEPSVGLSPKNIEIIKRKITETKEAFGCSFVIIEHRINDFVHMCDRVLSLKLGRTFKHYYPQHPDFALESMKEVFV